MHAGDDRSAEWRKCMEENCKRAKERIEHLSLACDSMSTKGARHLELEVCEDEEKVKWLFSGFCHAF